MFAGGPNIIVTPLCLTVFCPRYLHAGRNRGATRPAASRQSHASVNYPQSNKRSQGKIKGNSLHAPRSIVSRLKQLIKQNLLPGAALGFNRKFFFLSFLFAPTFDTLSEFATEMKVQLALGHMKTVSD